MNHCAGLLRRRKLSQESALSVRVAASGFSSTSTASQALQGLTDAISDGRLQSQMLTLASLSVSSAAYTQQPTVTTSAAIVEAVPAPAAKNSLPGILVATLFLHSHQFIYLMPTRRLILLADAMATAHGNTASSGGPSRCCCYTHVTHTTLKLGDVLCSWSHCGHCIGRRCADCGHSCSSGILHSQSPLDVSCTHSSC